ncbi:MAG TPA: ABC transporter ATP-binding protein [Bryobacteraceae bacterium]|nr:ABC transporter ATP-binding protein [Bryobacteraceae bacterium]
MSDTAPAIRLTDVRFSYVKGTEVLRIPTFELARKEKLFLFGPSGSGKTTLLGVLAGVLGGYSGSVEVLGRDLAKISGAQRDAFRGSHLGYIFQLFNLIPYLSVMENITLPCRLSAERRARLNGTSLETAAHDVAKRLGIDELLSKRVTNLSVGQQQRVAAARSLIGTPELIIADEPTSSLDFDHRERFLELLFESCKAAGSTLLFVSHDRSLMHLFDRQLSLPDINKAGQ